MKNATSALATAYTTLLADLSYQDKPVKLYSLMADDNAVAPYVILGPWVSQSDNTKESFGQSGEINLDVVTRFAGNTRSKKPAREIGDLITTLLKPTPTAEVLDVPGFHSWNTIITATRDEINAGSSDTIIRQIITVSHSLTEL